jgi:glycosyltransferase involved in cell wall biosynthesis
MWLRRVMAPILYHGKYRFTRRNWAVSRRGEALKPGITALVAARDEEYTIPLCLESLLGFADEIVCVDNGSGDRTLEQMKAFASRAPSDCEVKILQMPGATLGECREAGLAETTRTWHLRWDADMVAKTSGPEAMSVLKKELDADPRPRTIQLPRTNLLADLSHASRLYETVDPGEPILMTFGRDIRYVEDRRFDVVRVPRYYAQVRDPRRFYFHCASLKSDVNLLHRDVYFDWRQAVNSAVTDDERDGLKDYAAFRDRKNLERYGTIERRSLKYRYWRQVAMTLEKFDADQFGEYPEILRRELASANPRFNVTYVEGRPVGRIDLNDDEMRGYEPTSADLAWSPVEYLRKRLPPEDRKKLGL